MAIDWAAEGRRRGAEMARVEQGLYESFRNVVETTLAFIEPKVMGGRRPDPRGAFAAQGTFGRQADDWVESELRPVAEAPLERVERVIPASTRLITNYLEGARNRLVGVPDRVYALLKEIVEEAVASGMPNDELADRVGQLFSDEGVQTWDGRLMTIARTEAIAAQNAGTFASFLSLAALDPDTEWEKGWLSTEDTRTRETHRKADGQRVPLKNAFKVGGASLHFPGDPEGPPQEVINCRCSLLLLEPGEEIDMSNRQFEGD